MKIMLKKINGTILSYSLLIALGLIATLLLQRQNLRQINLEQDINYEQQQAVIEANLEIFQQAPTFGFRNLMADWIFLRFIQYYGDSEGREAMGNAVIPDFFDAVVKRDPKFVNAHLILSTATTMYAGQPDKTVDNLEEALTHLTPDIHRDAHFIWSYKGKDEMLFLNRIQEAKNSYRMAAQWVQASNMDEEAKTAIASRYLGTTNFLAENPDSVRARIGAWVMLLNNVQDQETRKRIIKEIEKLGGTVNISPSGRVNIDVPEED